jgi:molybdate transport system substrate-binding protein
MTLMLATCLTAAAADLTVFAASSLKTALDQIATDWQASTGNSVAISYDSSAKLAKQIEQGAPADLFISASAAWMDTLSESKLIKDTTRRDIIANSLILIAAGKVAAQTISPSLDLAGLLQGGMLSMGQIDSVPAGQYGKEALDTLGLWPSVAGNVVQSDNARAALALVVTAEAPYGIVYASDAVAAGAAISVVGTFPSSSHKPITYPAALTKTAQPEAQALLDALMAPDAQQAFKAQGFTLLN